MKNINRIIVFFTIALALVTTITACDKDESSNGGTPSIDYVRVTNPLSSDSLLIGAAQGKLIAIMGKNLGGAKQIWFNDQTASLNPTYITNNTILVNVPTVIPKSINNTLKLYFSNGDSLLHNFQVQISKPTVSNMLS
ncbi:MAG TPA: hypothetical protein VM935_07680, partial [Chitinophagaceae bacterium]|nr:hypothetical protein [Chitinophagaceae bacterium]